MLDANHVNAYGMRGIVYHQMAEIEKALLDWKELIRLGRGDLFRLPILKNKLVDEAFDPYRTDPRFGEIFELAKE